MANKKPAYIKHAKLLEYYASDPFISQEKLAEMFNISQAQVSRILNDPDCRAKIDEMSNDIWQRQRNNAMRTMEALSRRGNYRATEFLLRATGINPETRVVSDTDIKIGFEE